MLATLLHGIIRELLTFIRGRDGNDECSISLTIDDIETLTCTKSDWKKDISQKKHLSRTPGRTGFTEEEPCLCNHIGREALEDGIIIKLTVKKENPTFFCPEDGILPRTDEHAKIFTNFTEGIPWWKAGKSIQIIGRQKEINVEQALADH